MKKQPTIHTVPKAELPRQALDRNGNPVQYDVILADPPWDVGNRDPGRGAIRHYDLMTMEEIRNLPIGEMLKPKGHFWLWIPSNCLPYAWDLLDNWGLHYSGIFTWVKNRMGLGNMLRNTSEFMILATKGSSSTAFKGQPNWGFYPVTSMHSEKPLESYAVIHRMRPDGNRLEMFARKRIPGYDVWGFEAPGGSDIVIPGYPVPKYSWEEVGDE